MEGLINKALSIEKDCAGMDKLAQLNYVANLYEEMSRVSPSQIGNLTDYSKALTQVERIWYSLAAECKEEMIAELKQRVSSTPYCSMKKLVGKIDAQVIEVSISNQFSAEIWYKWGSKINIGFCQYYKDKNNHDTSTDVVVRWKIIPEWLKNSAKYVQGLFEKDVTIDNWVDVALETAAELKNHEVDVIEFCKKSSNIDDNGNVIKQYKVWKTIGKVISIKKEMPIVHMYHAKKSGQELLDNSPFVHGSNGTYVENANAYWCLIIKVKRPSYEVVSPLVYSIDIHEYITQRLMQKLEWERLSQDRLTKLNDILSGTKIELETYDTGKAALYREFKPVGFNGWNDYLDSIILSRI